jgi:hypothetical protein
MSIPRKRGKVKKKLAAAKKVVKKAASRSKKPKPKSKPKAPTKKKARKKAKRPPSVNTRPQRPPKQPALKKPAKRKKKKPAIRRTPPKSVSGRRKRSKGLTLEQALERPLVIEEVFLRSPAVQQQITERIIEKGLAELTRGMVQTPESLILGSLIIAEQLGNFDQRAKELAIEHNMSLREIYELWLSPPTKDL